MKTCFFLLLLLYPGNTSGWNNRGDDERVSKKKHKWTLCGDNMCKCANEIGQAVCVNQGHRLNYIPRFNQKIGFLNFSGNYLASIDNKTFINITNLELGFLQLGNNSLQNCSTSSLTGLTYLRHLIITHDVISATELLKCLSGVSRGLTSLKLAYLKNIKPFELNFSSSMENKSVKELEIRNIHMREFDQSVFLALKKIGKMLVTDNKIRSTKFQHSFTITYLSLAFNQIKQFPTFCVNGSAFFTNLKTLHLEDNRIWNIPTEKIACMKSLLFFSIDDNPIIKIDGNTFSTLPNLHVVSITYTGNTVLLLKAFAFNSSSIKQLYLEDDHFSVGDTYKHVDLNAFKYCNQLETLRLGSNYLSNGTDDIFDELFSTLVNLKSLSLSDCGLHYLPRFIPQYLHKLEILWIDRNNIISIPDSYFENLPLHNVDLSRNKIPNIGRNTFSLKFFINIKEIDLSRNPFSCSCELRWFIKFLKIRTFEKFVHFPKGYTCYSPTSLQGKQLTHVNISKRTCAITKQVRVIIISISAGILLLLLTISAVYRYRWYLRYILYMARFQHVRCQRLLNGGVNYKYDAYLSSCDADFDDVIYDELVPRLEGEMGLRLYIPQRDGQGNKIDQIISNMDASRKVILFISDKYVEDSYCEFEASFAYNKYINERRDLMIVVVLRELLATNVTKTIHTILAVDNYIKWGWDEESLELFWLKITTAINNMDDLIP